MPNVLIIGATGYIGSAVASSLLRSGRHSVYGLARSDSSAQALAKNEIIPIHGALPDTSPILPYLLNHSIDIIINAGSAPQHRNAVLDLLKEASQIRAQHANKSGVRVPKLGYVVVSGTWVHGELLDEQVNDLRPVGSVNGSPVKTTDLTTWLPLAEQDYLALGDLVNVAIVRPALVYGRECSIWSPLFSALWSGITTQQSTITLPVAENARPGLIHIDDVAEGITCIVDKIELISAGGVGGVWPVFDLITSQEAMKEIFEAAARTLGFSGKLVFAGPGEDAFLKALSTSFNGSSGRAEGLLGWNPKRVGMTWKVSMFIKGWIAAQEDGSGWGRWEERLKNDGHK